MHLCEYCGQEATTCCSSLDQAALWFCDDHYNMHVDADHGGKPLPGAPAKRKPRRKP